MMDDHGQAAVAAADEIHPVIDLLPVQIHADQEAFKVLSGDHSFSVGYVRWDG